MAISKNIYLDQPRRGKTREVQVTPYKRNTVWRLSRVTVWSARWCATILLMVAVLSLSAQTVSKVTAEQVGKTIHVSYDLDKTANIALFLSIDGGKTYRELHKVTGAVGKNVHPGHRTIVWQVLGEVEKLRGDNFVFKVKADPVVTIPTVMTNDNAGYITSTSAFIWGIVLSDGGASVTSCGFCWSTSPVPTVSDAHSTEGGGIETINATIPVTWQNAATEDGGGIKTIDATITGLKPNTTYYVRSYATNSKGTGYGKVISFTTKKEDCKFVRDYDGNVYNAVLIGEQCWMRENLRTTHYADGTYIPMDGKSSSTSARRYCPDGSFRNVSSYGYLYNWRAVMQYSSSSNANPSGVQGVCPAGWHIPSYAEWMQLEMYVSSQTGFKCGGRTYISKALVSTTGWRGGDKYCGTGVQQSFNNATGFTALPAGKFDGDYHCFSQNANFWSSTIVSPNSKFVRVLYITFNKHSVSKHSEYMGYGFSVRCLRD